MVPKATVLVLAGLALFAGDKKRDWIPAEIIAISKGTDGAKGSATKVISQAADTVNVSLQYTVETAEETYVLKVFNPSPPGSSTRLPPRPAPKVQVGDQVEIAVKKNDAWLVDSAGKEHLCTVVKRIDKP